MVLRSTAGGNSPSSMACSCSSESASVSLLGSDEDGLTGSSFSHSTSAPVREGWTEPPTGEVGPGVCPVPGHPAVQGEEGEQSLTSFEEQLGEGGGAQASGQVQGGVPGKSPSVDICSQLRRCKVLSKGCLGAVPAAHVTQRSQRIPPLLPGPCRMLHFIPVPQPPAHQPHTFFTRWVAMLRFSISTARCRGVLPPCLSTAFTSAPFLTSKSRQAKLFAFTAKCTGRRPATRAEAQQVPS